MVSQSSTAARTSYYRKIIVIKAEDSPNVQYALAEIANGKQPSGKVLVPGVITYDEYVRRRKTWNIKRQTIGLDAQFYEGAEVLLYPPVWLERARRLAQIYKGHKRRAKAIGIDPGEGTANTAMCVGDELGVIELVSKQTPNTNVIKREVIAFGRKHNVPPKMWFFDRGGGGKQHADDLREMGYDVETVAFGAAVTPPPALGPADSEERRDDAEGRYAYKNRRAEMYGGARELLDPGDENAELVENCKGYAIPDDSDPLKELHRQLVLFPLLYDGHGRMYLPPKNRRDPNSTEVTLTEIIGCSPDESDAFVLMVYGLSRPDRRPVVGAW